MGLGTADDGIFVSPNSSFPAMAAAAAPFELLLCPYCFSIQHICFVFLLLVACVWPVSRAHF